MKKINFIALAMMCSLISTAQINLEHTYSNASGSSKDFGILNLDSVTYKYYLLDLNKSEFTLYNFNHSVYKHVSIPETWNNYNYSIGYITTSMFDCDGSNIEYVLNHNNPSYVKIYREDGNIIFWLDSVKGQSCFGCITILNTYITKTPQGTKMMLRHDNGNIKVYGLCGNLPSGYYKTSNDSQENSSLSMAYPNPTDNYTRIDYQLPQGINKGDIVFYDIQGKEVKRFTVDRTFDHLQITTNELLSGTYYYNLQTSNEVSVGKKLIIIK